MAEDPKMAFYRQFQNEATQLQDEINSLSAITSTGNERQAIVDRVLAGISKLSKDLMDATDFIPSYDQRTYSQTIKTITDKLNEKTEKQGPKSRFQFKPRNKTAAAGESSQGTPDARVHRPWGNNAHQSNTDLSTVPDAAEVRDTVSTGKDYDYNLVLSRPGDTRGVRKPSFSTAKNIVISGHVGLHVILPSTASTATSSGSLTNLKGCVVDMTVPTSTAPFSGLALKNITHSLIIAGHVAGPAHITGIENSIIIVAARQVRMHDCKNVCVYLHCTSHPIIEDCSRVAFAPLPPFYGNESTKTETNQWKDVDDFKWLKDIASPNWSILAEEDRISDDVWENLAREEAGRSAGDILRKLKIATEAGQ